LSELKEFNSSYQDYENLYAFLWILQRFNGGEAYSEELLLKYERYFQYRWENDRNFATSSMQDQRIITVLPIQLQWKVFK